MFIIIIINNISIIIATTIITTVLLIVLARLLGDGRAVAPSGRLFFFVQDALPKLQFGTCHITHYDCLSTLVYCCTCLKLHR